MNTFSRVIVITLSIILSACAGDNVRLSAADDEDRDIGLGGTGLIAGLDNGLGGTGIVGQITGFGSIFVNGIEIEYHDGTPMTIDGQTVEAAALHIGDVVEVLTTDSSKHTQAMRINVRHEVIGKVSAVDEHSSSFTVLGQKVMAGDEVLLPEPGSTVAVAGTRIDDTHIRATRVTAVAHDRELLRKGMELPYSNDVKRWLIQTSVRDGQVAVDLDGSTQTVPVTAVQVAADQHATGIVELYQSPTGALNVRKVVDPVKLPRGRQVITPGRTAGAPSVNPMQSPPGLPGGSIPGSQAGPSGGALPSVPGPSKFGLPSKLQYR